MVAETWFGNDPVITISELFTLAANANSDCNEDAAAIFAAERLEEVSLNVFASSSMIADATASDTNSEAPLKATVLMKLL